MLLEEIAACYWMRGRAQRYLNGWTQQEAEKAEDDAAIEELLTPVVIDRCALPAPDSMERYQRYDTSLRRRVGTQDDNAQASGVDSVVFLKASGLRIHPPDEVIARRVAKVETDGFAAATAQELGARFHTTDGELVRQLRRVRLAITHY